MFAATLLSLGVVFLAELGDKSQLITMTYALRYRWWIVLSGVGIAAFLVHGISVTVGHFLGVTLPARPIAFAAAIAFLGFAVWTWWETRDTGADDPDAEVATAAAPRFVIFAVISSFVLAELGDKTMLATVALASNNQWAGVWLGATAGMVLADGVAIAVGRLLRRRLPERFLHLVASLLFLLFGLWILFNNALGHTGWAVAVTATAAVIAVSGALLSWRKRRRAQDRGTLSEPSQGAP